MSFVLIGEELGMSAFNNGPPIFNCPSDGKV